MICYFLPDALAGSNIVHSFDKIIGWRTLFVFSYKSSTEILSLHKTLNYVTGLLHINNQFHKSFAAKG